MINSKLMFVN